MELQMELQLVEPRINIIKFLAIDDKSKARREALRLWNMSNQVEPRQQKHLRSEARKLIKKWGL